MHARKSLNCREGTTDKNVDVKGNSGGNSGRKECSRESLLDISYIYHIYKPLVYHLREDIQAVRMLVEIWTRKVILRKSQLEMKNMLMETERKEIIIRK